MINPYTLSSDKSLDSYTVYDTTWGEPGQTLVTREGLYARMPNVTTLRMRVNGYLGQTFYLRPTLQSIHLDFTLSFQEGRPERPADLLYKAGFVECFKALERLVSSPECRLQELSIQFVPDVTLYLCIPDAHVAEYDEYGPVYEDEEWIVTTQRLHPSEVLASLRDTQDTLDRIGQALVKVLSIRPLTTITLPAHFPAADMVQRLYPVATLTDRVDTKEATRRVVKTISDYHTEHIETHRYLLADRSA